MYFNKYVYIYIYIHIYIYIFTYLSQYSHYSEWFIFSMVTEMEPNQSKVVTHPFKDWRPVGIGDDLT